MDSDTIKKIISNLRDPMNASQKIHFTSRCVLFLQKLFSGMSIDEIDLHCILLRFAFSTYRSDYKSIEEKYISLTEAITYLYTVTPSCVTKSDIVDVASQFDIMKDNKFGEVKNALHILQELSM